MSVGLANQVNPLLYPEDAEWAPRYATKPLKLATVLEGEELVPVFNDNSLGEMVEGFALTFLKATRGFRSGQPIQLTKWQKTLIRNLMEIDSEGVLRYRTALIMLPRKNGKTFLVAIIALVHLLIAPEGAEIYSAAVDRQQARLVFEQISKWIKASPVLEDVLDITDSKNIITNKKTGSFYRALSADAASAQGYAPYLVIADEIHAWESQNGSKRAIAFWDALTKGSADRPEYQTIVISTAGENMNDSLLGSLYLRGKRAIENPDADPNFGFFCWEADEADNPLDIATWRKANPNIAEGLMNISTLEESLRGSASINMSGFLRYHLNVWARLQGDPFMAPFWWQKSINEFQTDIPHGSRITIGFDASHNKDATSIVIQDFDTGFFKVYASWEKPVDADENWHIPREKVVEAVLQLNTLYDIIIMNADPKLYETEIPRWRDIDKINVQEFYQTRSRIMPVAEAFRMDIIEGRITHDGGEVLSRHILNAIYDPDKAYRKPTKDSRQHIDSLAASVMANAGRNFYKLREQKKATSNQAQFLTI